MYRDKTKSLGLDFSVFHFCLRRFQVRQLRVVRHIIYSNRITGIDVKIESERFGLDTCLFETTSQVPSRYFLPVNINLDVFYD